MLKYVWKQTLFFVVDLISLSRKTTLTVQPYSLRPLRYSNSNSAPMFLIFLLLHPKKRNFLIITICILNSLSLFSLSYCRFDVNGSWSKRGCSLVKKIDNEITCSCNHLTNFAVLMQIGSKEVSDRIGQQVTFNWLFICRWIWMTGRKQVTKLTYEASIL